MTTNKSYILDILNRADEPLLVADIANRLGSKHVIVSRVLNTMWKNKEVQRFFGPGHSYRYGLPGKRFKDIYAPAKPKRTKPKSQPKPIHAQPRPNINPATLRSLLDSWSEKRWEPKVYQSTSALPLALGKLYELSAEAGFGSIIPQKELNYYREQLSKLVEDAHALYMISTAILEKEEIWNAGTLPTFLLTEANDPIRLQALARKLKELNS